MKRLFYPLILLVFLWYLFIVNYIDAFSSLIIGIVLALFGGIYFLLNQNDGEMGFSFALTGIISGILLVTITYYLDYVFWFFIAGLIVIILMIIHAIFGMRG